MAAKRDNFPQVFVITNALVPAGLLTWELATNRAGVEPGQHALLTTGMLALIFLGLSLAVTPVRKITGLAWLFYLRRTLGLIGFFYAFTHVAIYMIYRKGLDITAAFREIFNAPYLVFGLFAFVILTALALTSFQSSPRLLGSKRWQLLHRLVYAAAIFVVIHYMLHGKVVEQLSIGFAIAIGMLLAYRVAVFLAGRVRPATVRQR